MSISILPLPSAVCFPIVPLWRGVLSCSCLSVEHAWVMKLKKHHECAVSLLSKAACLCRHLTHPRIPVCGVISFFRSCLCPSVYRPPHPFFLSDSLPQKY